MMGDGNCMFRSLSFVLSGSQYQHFAVRKLVCNHVYSIERSTLGHIAPHLSVEDYLKSTHMSKNNVLGTDVQLRAFANLFNTNVNVYVYEHKSWCVFPPLLTLTDKDVTARSVYLLHPPAHYDLLCGQSAVTNVGSQEHAYMCSECLNCVLKSY